MGTVSLLVVALLLCASLLGSSLTSSWRKSPETATAQGFEKRDTSNLYDSLGRFILTDYDAKPPISNFLPALAGYFGKPLYAFYVNRGQGIASFGSESKDYPILEFSPANKAYQTALLGFRTFIQGARPNQTPFLVEPFSPAQTRYASLTREENDQRPVRNMYVGSNEMQIQEVNLAHNIETNVSFFILPEENFGAFVKRTTITNIDKKVSLTFALLDGLAKIEPAGGKLNDLLKDMGRTLEAWMGVYFPSQGTNTMPFFRLSTQPADSAAVTVQEAGHWVLSVIERDTLEMAPILYDRDKVFGQDTTLLYPTGLLQKSVAEILKQPQYGAAKTASAFAALESVTLKPGESITISTFYGKTGHVLDLPVIARRLLEPGFVPYKVQRSREIIGQITASVEVKSSNPLWDGHVQQMYLDNSLRGGVPSILGEVDDDARMRNVDEDPRLKVYHLFSRIHGDLERDYNNFTIESTFFSQVREMRKCRVILALFANNVRASIVHS
jgi:hypothetical protein